MKKEEKKFLSAPCLFLYGTLCFLTENHFIVFWVYFCVNQGSKVDWRCWGLNSRPSDPQPDAVKMSKKA